MYLGRGIPIEGVTNTKARMAGVQRATGERKREQKGLRSDGADHGIVSHWDVGWRAARGFYLKH